MKGSISIRDIARQCGVSHTTVSNVLNRKGHENFVSTRRAEQIRQIARQMGYIRNDAARSLRLGRTQTILLITCERLCYPYVNELVEQIHAALLPHHYRLNLELLFDIVDSDHVHRTIFGGRCDGVIKLALIPEELESFLEIKRRGLPVVIAVPGLPCKPEKALDWVDYDRVGAAHMGVQHLIGLGHRRIAFVLGTGEDIRHSPRSEGYRQALEEAQIPIDENRFFPWAVEGDPAELWKQISARPPLPTAVFTFNEEVAIGLLHSIRLAGLRVPDDIALVTQSNSRLVRLAEVPLTAVDSNNPAIAQAVVNQLMSQIENPAVPPRHTTIKPFLVIRSSSVPSSNGRGRSEELPHPVEERH